MEILLHVCCANCTIYPVQELRKEGIEVLGFFYNPNIHPYQEYRRRLETVEEYSNKISLNMTYNYEYKLEEFLQNVVFRESERCLYCYYARLKQTAQLARKERIDFFSTTMLYSKFQKHEKIKEIGEGLAKEYGVRFYYRDFREGWKKGIEISKILGLYRQQYCGCIYSEKERYLKKNA
ncbi:MAG: epoxyqueuosine reductase QueH [Pseudomonadota bacterium]